MKLGKAIAKKNLAEVKRNVAVAVKTYGAERPEAPILETACGPLSLPLLLEFDKKAVWQLLLCEYTAIVAKAQEIPDSADQEIEIAKLIATNPLFRNLDTENATLGKIL